MEDMEYLRSKNLGNARSIVARMNTSMGFPSVARKTTTYCQIEEHQSQSGEYLIPIKGVGAPNVSRGIATIDDLKGNITPDERNEVVTREILEAEGAFSIDEGI